MAVLLCEPHRERGLSIPAVKIVASTPMCADCFAGHPISVSEVDELHQLLEMLPAVPRVLRRKSYGIRTLSSAEQVRRRKERVRTIRPRTSWRRGKKELKLPIPREPSLSISPRQSEILSLLARGISTKKIAMELGISERTVTFHFSCLFKKSGTNNRMNLLLWHLAKTGAVTPAPENSLVQISAVGIEEWQSRNTA